MVSRSQQKQRRYVLCVTAQEAADIVWAAWEGLERIDETPEGEALRQRIVHAVQLLEATIQQGGEIWP